MNLDPSLQLALRTRPIGRPAMFQKWRDLTFFHFSIDPSEVQALLPPGLTVDTFDGKAWIGFVPFWMTAIRFPYIPPVPGTHTFPETNVRTYVHRRGKDPGVWFFSLDAANALAVWWARKFFGLPYHLAEMMVSGKEEIQYRSVRHRGNATHQVEVQIGDPLPYPVPGSLDFYLVERYLLYTLRGDHLYSGIVNHEPYALRSVEVKKCEESMVRAIGIEPRSWEHVCYSPGVNVEVFGLKPVA